MTPRWQGALIFGIALPVFFFMREGVLNQTTSLVRKVVNTGLFTLGVLGMCLILFGNFPNAFFFLGLWCLSAWLYNL
jgi:hypothetical protein